MRHLLIILILLFFVVFPSCKTFNKKDKAMAELAALHAKQDSIRVIDSIRVAQERLIAIENARLEAAAKAEEERVTNSKYNIIVGSFITPEYAVRLADVYKKNGYNSTILKMKGSTFELVSAEAHESLKKAFARKLEFQNSIEKDAWVYIVK